MQGCLPVPPRSHRAPLAREGTIEGMATVKLPGLEGHDWIDAREVARILGISPDSVRMVVKRKHLKPQKFGSSSVFDLKDVQRYAERRRAPGRPPKRSAKKS
jgi:hypothetical protein